MHSQEHCPATPSPFTGRRCSLKKLIVYDLDGTLAPSKLSGNNVDIVALQKAPVPQITVTANREGDLGEFLGRLGPDRFYVDLRGADDPTKTWGKLKYYSPDIGWLFDPTKFLTDPDESGPTIPSFDILVYSRKVSPSTMWFP